MLIFDIELRMKYIIKAHKKNKTQKNVFIIITNSNNNMNV